MTMRITPQVLLQQAIYNAQMHENLLALYQEQASTGNKLIQPSDDPLGMLTVLSSQAQDNRLGVYLTNIQTDTNTLNASVSTLQSASNIMQQAHQIAIEGTSATNDSSAYNAMVSQVNALLNSLVNLANTQNQGHYLYGGSATGQAPFNVVRDSQGNVQSVTYVGNTGSTQSPINDGQSVAISFDGSSIFQQRARGATVYTGATGAAAGSGTDSATGEGTLTVTHTTTTYDGSSGVQAGTGSAAGDTIIGPSGANTLTITDTSGTGASGTVSLNGGPAVNWTSVDTNLQVIGPRGEAVYIDTSAITAGFNDTVNITANGKLSVDGGASQVPIDFSHNQIVTDSRTGAVTNVDSSNIRQTGTDHLEYTGTYDAFQILLALRDDLQNTRGLSAADQAQVLSGRLAEIDRVQQSILSVVGKQSSDLQNMQGLQTRLQQVQLDARSEVSNLQGADMSSVVLNLQSQQTLLQFALQASARISNQSLLDYLPVQ
ncbi:MAG TPA: flagellar hook-associated protein FlgL [Gemmataceae bacterium]|nr:flagellar hook-associated protein FlgL [Gemmataceae bacterium]